MGNLKTNRLALGALFTAMSVIALILSGVLPGVEMTMYLIASLMPAFMIIEMKAAGGILVYGASALLGFILMPNKLAILPYVFFFGIYPIIKYYAEKPKNPVVQLAVKLAFSMIVFGIAYFFFKEMFFANINLPEKVKGLPIIVAIPGFLLYDYVFTLVLNTYMSKMHGGKNK